jgi:hypothetical protein
LRPLYLKYDTQYGTVKQVASRIAGRIELMQPRLPCLSLPEDVRDIKDLPSNEPIRLVEGHPITRHIYELRKEARRRNIKDIELVFCYNCHDAIGITIGAKTGIL